MGLRRKTILLLIFSSFMSVGWGQDCNGCNPGETDYVEHGEGWIPCVEWVTDINQCNPDDINVLQMIIENSNLTINPLELGIQLWENGRLIHWICQEVPSPYYFYEYDCGLSGKIPKEIGDLDGLVKLRLQNNDLNGNIPQSICNLNNVVTGNYWFNLDYNNLCPPYPNCIENIINHQSITKCK